MSVDVVDDFFVIDGETSDYVGEVCRCLTCGAVFLSEDPSGCDCEGAAYAVYSLHHVEGDDGEMLWTPTEEGE